jgi:hypothetical protein
MGEGGSGSPIIQFKPAGLYLEPPQVYLPVFKGSYLIGPLLTPLADRPARLKPKG